jgi:hypothetical protein
MCATDGAGKPTHDQPSGDPLGSGANRRLADMISIGPGVPRGLPDRLAVLLELFVEAAAGMEQQRRTSSRGQAEGIITFVFTCPHTGLRVQGWVCDDAAETPAETYEPVSCHACGGMHLVDRRSGRVLGSSNA